ncbi:hypothetical protein M8J77_022640 [Diaphorina citri]|nr:hypothetical protein M8J77_022640 [Diaphorina citri]
MGNHFSADRYELVRRVGKGSFGDVYIGRDKTNQEEVAMKVEPVRNPVQRLFWERNFYEKLHGAPGVPHVMGYGTSGDYNILVMELLGPSLEDLFQYCSKRFSLKTVLMLADQMISRLEHVHRKKIVHRDIKPDNFLMGVRENFNTVYLVDFGLAVDFCPNCPPRIRTRGLTGTARYASVNAHQWLDQSPRDDLEALCYTLVYFLRGKLPWQSIKSDNEETRMQRVTEMKLTMTPEAICEGTPPEFAEFLRYCRGLAFSEEPNYGKLRDSFRNLLENKERCEFDLRYDWTLLERK